MSWLLWCASLVISFLDMRQGKGITGGCGGGGGVRGGGGPECEGSRGVVCSKGVQPGVPKVRVVLDAGLGVMGWR
jgi:hypothetical protein